MYLNTILEILKYTLPAIIVFFTAYFIIRSFLKSESEKAQAKARFTNRKDILTLRLQAYERLSVFMERISPSNLIPRVIQPDMTAKGFHYALIMSIRAEYEHNLSQQIYVSNNVWSIVTIVKDEMIKQINLISASAPPNASGRDLSKAILDFYLESEESIPTQNALLAIKGEVQKLY